MDLVVVSLEAWDTVWRRNQHLVSRLLIDDPTLRVLFVEPAADPLHDFLSRRPLQRSVPLSPVAGFEGRLTRYRPLKLLPRRFDNRADDRLASAVIKAARMAEIPRPLLWLNDPGAVPLARKTDWPTLYDITDDWAAADRTPVALARVRAAEEWLLLHAAAVVACSEELVRRKSHQRPSGTIDLIPNAVDVAAYQDPTARPSDLPVGLVALYVGTLHRDRLDVELCLATASALPDAGTLVLVGPNSLDDADTRRLRAGGVAILGARPHARIPAYLQHADALLVPHLVTGFTESLDPIKLYEYQAVDAAVIATPVAGFRDWNDARITLADRDAFPDAVRMTLQGLPRRARSSRASVPDWSTRTHAIRAVLDRIVQEHATSAPPGAPAG